jgi:hypothetical protein
MLSVTNKPTLLSVVMLSVIVLNAMAPSTWRYHTQHNNKNVTLCVSFLISVLSVIMMCAIYAECRGAYYIQLLDLLQKSGNNKIQPFATQEIKKMLYNWR